ncbi:MAG: DoxX family protein [Neisseriaceae bacterium]|nr:DoxX family protein [Neisseriaceae bacterium]MBP6861776.1 DoxX family protein [Neisseriaceae bacterium]
MTYCIESRWLWFLARALLMLMFVSSGLAKLLDYEGGLAEMRAAGLQPDWFFNVATAAVLLVASALVLLDRWLWLGAAALAVFLGLTILIVHTFWQFSDAAAKLSLMFAIEHLAVMGGLISTAIASHYRRLWHAL